MARSIINTTRFFMIVTGLWKIPLSQEPFVQKSYNIYSTTVLTIINTFTFSVIIRLIQLLITEDATPGKIFGSITVAIIVSMINYTVFIFLKNGIPDLLVDIVDEETKALNSVDEEIKISYINQAKYYKWTTTFLMISTFSSAVMFAASSVYKKITGSFLEHEAFMYDMWFPFDKTKHDSLVVIANMVMVVLGSSFNVASRITPQTLIIFINAQLRILQIRIRKLFSNDDCDDEKVLRFKVKELVRKHQWIISFTSSLNNSIKSVIFFEFVLNSINVAAALLQVITVKNIAEMGFSFFHLTLVVLQIFILAWSANEINIQSANIANAVYESNWMDQSEEIKKIMYIMLIRAQKPLALTIGPFRPINLESALITLKGAYTYASVMIQKYT